MKDRFRLYQRNGGIFYIFDNISKKRESLNTKDRVQAKRLLLARNEAHQQPALNLQIARAYLAGSDPQMSRRTWEHVIDEIMKIKEGVTLDRWARARQDKAFDLIRNMRLIDTQGEHFLSVLRRGTVSTNVFLRRMHNFALDMNWLLCSILPRKHWPPVRFNEKRAITFDEHQRILMDEHNPELKLFYALLWHLGGSQSDIATLCSEDIDWTDRTIGYSRKKTGCCALIHFGDETASLLASLPKEGWLFPRLANMHEKHRAKEFKRRCRSLGIGGVTLHSYRYAWAERAKTSGYPERFAQQALGHNSKAVHRAYAKKAQVKLPSLEEYEKRNELEAVPKA